MLGVRVTRLLHCITQGTDTHAFQPLNHNKRHTSLSAHKLQSGSLFMTRPSHIYVICCVLCNFSLPIYYKII